VLLAVPNVSEGRDSDAIAAIGAAFAGARVLDVHSDADHNRTVFSLAAPDLPAAVAAGAREAIARIDLHAHAGVHPRVGSLDVAPIVYLREQERGAATAAALVLGDLLGELGLPVYLYGAFGPTRAELRRPGALDGRPPDFGPPYPHPTAGATLVTARPPLVAFNVEVDAPLERAKAIAAEVRRLPGVVALGVPLGDGRVQVTANLEGSTTPAQLVAAVRGYAPVVQAELVALAPEAAFADFPADVPMPGFDPDRQLIERALAA
jgi:glutamate formiminotransferase / 5-formyltetrahydrofolate cyclo-ligase